MKSDCLQSESCKTLSYANAPWMRAVSIARFQVPTTHVFLHEEKSTRLQVGVPWLVTREGDRPLARTWHFCLLV